MCEVSAVNSLIIVCVNHCVCEVSEVSAVNSLIIVCARLVQLIR